MALDWHMYQDPALVLERKQEAQAKGGRAKQNMEALFGGNLTDDRIDFRLRIPAGLDERLENWGWLSRDRKRPGISQTGKICHRLAVLAGAYKHDDVKAPPTAAQLQDAQLIERAWRQDLLPMKQKMLLAGYYVYRLDPRKICRAAAIRYREFDESMYRACHMINNIALRIAASGVMGDNCRDNSTTGTPRVRVEGA